jgi:hypothetical protein
VVTRLSPAVREVSAGRHTLTSVRRGRALDWAGRVSGPRGTRCHLSRPGRSGREPARRERPWSRPVSWSLAGRAEVAGRPVLTGWAVPGRAELPARHRLTRQDAGAELTGLSELSRRTERARRGKLPGSRRSAVGHARAGHELARRYRPGRNGTRAALLLTEGHGSAVACVSRRELARRGHPGRQRSARLEWPGRHRPAGELTRLRRQVAGRNAAGRSGPVEPRCALPARTAEGSGPAGASGTTGERNLTRTGEAAGIRPAVERARCLLPWSLWSWRLSGELLSGKLLLLELRPSELRPGAERPRVWLLGEGSADWTSGAGLHRTGLHRTGLHRTGLHRTGLSRAHLAVAGEASPVLTAAVRSSFVPRAAVRPSAVRRSRVRPTRRRTARPPAAVLAAAELRIGRRRAARRPAAGKLTRMVWLRLPGSVRPGRRHALRAAGNRALHPGTGGGHARPARSGAVGATFTRPRPPGGLANEAGPAREPPGSGPGPASRDRTAAHAVVTRTPAEPRTPIPRALVIRETPVASWTGAPAGPGVDISAAFVVRPVFGARPPTPAPPPREPCHIIDRKHPDDR